MNSFLLGTLHLVIIFLVAIPRDVLVFDHMLYLTSHCQDKQDDKIHQQYWPEYR